MREFKLALHPTKTRLIRFGPHEAGGPIGGRAQNPLLCYDPQSGKRTNALSHHSGIIDRLGAGEVEGEIVHFDVSGPVPGY
jgi:hypothetical protein